MLKKRREVLKKVATFLKKMWCFIPLVWTINNNELFLSKAMLNNGADFYSEEVRDLNY